MSSMSTSYRIYYIDNGVDKLSTYLSGLIYMHLENLEACLDST